MDVSKLDARATEYTLTARSGVCDLSGVVIWQKEGVVPENR